ncbi:MAG: [Fe-Fe] hydrogenase large subunit C-terminal domain-containing protein [Gemmatimonadaceae bacterium]
MSARPSADAPNRRHEVAIVGNDMLLAALPGRAVQLAHAIQACGYDLVVPVSWGEELLAEHALLVLEQAGLSPLVFCACPRVRTRLMASGNEIVPHLLSAVSPPVATARYLRAMQPDAPMRITYIGGCEGARDDSIDAHVQPDDFLRHLEQRGISIVRQPSVFEATVPPDRRRHWSLPGGAPSPNVVQARTGSRSLLVVDDRDLAAEIADHILVSDRLLIDVAPALGCRCAGALEVHLAHGSRDAVMALEPPVSTFPVIETEFRVPLDSPLPRLTASSSGVAHVSSRAPAGDESGVRSIQDAVRARAERRRIAVTPASVGEQRRATASDLPLPQTTSARPTGLQTRTPAVATPVSRSMPAAQREPSARLANDARAPRVMTAEPAITPPATVPDPAVIVPVHAPAPGEETAPAAPAREVASSAAGREAVAPPEAAASRAAPSHAPTPEAAAAIEVRTRHRTPAYEMRHIARSAAHARQQSTGQPLWVPRTYAAVRSRTVPVEVRDLGEPVASAVDDPGAVEAQPRVVTPFTAVMDPPPSLRDAMEIPSHLHQAAPGAIRSRGRSAPESRHANPRPLWGLLVSVLLIAAIAVLLFVIFGV